MVYNGPQIIIGLQDSPLEKMASANSKGNAVQDHTVELNILNYRGNIAQNCRGFPVPCFKVSATETFSKKPYTADHALLAH